MATFNAPPNGSKPQFCEECDKPLEGGYEKSHGVCMGCLKKNNDKANAKAAKKWAGKK